MIVALVEHVVSLSHEEFARMGYIYIVFIKIIKKNLMHMIFILHVDNTVTYVFAKVNFYNVFIFEDFFVRVLLAKVFESYSR